MSSCETCRKMVGLDEALALIDRMRADFYRAMPVEEIPIQEAVGRRLAADAVARLSTPARDICTMDGYALRAADGYPLRVAGEAFAGREFRHLEPGEAAYVTTGAMLPDGANAVLPVEDAKVEGGVLYGKSLKAWTHVVRAGSDMAPGKFLLARGSVIAPAMAGAFRAAGIDRVTVYRKTRVAVLATGDEITDGTIADANGPMACAMLESWGCTANRLATVRDDAEEISHAVEAALADNDMAITIGGVSMGKMDKVSSVVEAGEVIFKGVRMKPGKPFIASYCGRKPVFSLPGKPSGSYTAMELLVRRFIVGQTRVAAVSMPLSRDVELKTPGFDYVIFVELSDGEARPVGYAGSSVELISGAEYDTSLLSTTARTTLSDGYFITRDPVKAGQPVSVNLSR